MAQLDPRVVGRLPTIALDVVAYRNQAVGFEPRSGEGARRQGGRFNPPHSFPVVYLCTTQPCVVAELTRQATRQGLQVDDLLPRELWKVTTHLDRVLDLTDSSVLAALALMARDLVRDDVSLTNEIGESAHQFGFQAIRAPSATGVDHVLAIFTENLAGAMLVTERLAEWHTTDDLTG